MAKRSTTNKGNGKGNGEKHVFALWFAADHAVPTNVNTRKENHGEEKVLGVDLSLTAMLPHTVLDQLEPGAAKLWRPTLWTEEGAVRETGLGGAMKFRRKATGIHVKLSVPTIHDDKRDELVMRNATVGKFTVRPAAGFQVELGMQIQCDDFDNWKQAAGWITERFVDGKIDFEFSGSTQTDIDDPDPDDPPADPPDPARAAAEAAVPSKRAFPDAFDGTGKVPH